MSHYISYVKVSISLASRFLSAAVQDVQPVEFETPKGEKITLILESRNCHLSKMTPAELVKHGELVNETGGYFIINGACRILRLLIANRRNYPLAMTRQAWKYTVFTQMVEG